MTRGKAEQGITELIKHLGYELDGEGLSGTPARVVRAYEELTKGEHEDAGLILSRTFDPPPGGYDEMIILSGIDYVAVCEHHLLPFPGVAVVAYLPTPGAPVVGLSKLARVVDVYARRLTMQEKITVEVTAALDRFLNTQGSACILRSRHQCMTIRGVHKQDGTMITSSMTGKFRDTPEARAELLALADHCRS